MSTLHNSLEGLETAQSRDALEARVQSRALRLHLLLEKAPVSAGDHPWNRPGLYVAKTDFSRGEYGVSMQAHNGENFHLMRGDGLFRLSTHAHNPATSYEVHLALNPKGVEVLGFLRSDANARAFVHAERTLSQAIHAIEGALPMDEGLTWPQSLFRELERARGLGGTERWNAWMGRWATEEMRRVSQLAFSLADPRVEFQHWKDIVLSGWRSLEEQRNEVSGPSMAAFTEF